MTIYFTLAKTQIAMERSMLVFKKGEGVRNLEIRAKTKTKDYCRCVVKN